MRLSERQTNDLIFRLEERKYGHRLTSMQLAQKARVELDAVNRLENQLPIADPAVIENLADALGVTPDLLCKIAGYEEISVVDLAELEQCLAQCCGGELSERCLELGLLPVPSEPLKKMG